MALTNRIDLIGNCGENPISIPSQQNKKIIKVSVYTNDWWYNEDGLLEEQKEIHRCLFFGSNAERAIRFLQKGTQIHLTGKIHYEHSKNHKGMVYAKVIVKEFMVADRIMISKEMYQNLFPGQETNRVELARERYEMENFDQEVARIENRAKELTGRGRAGK